MREWSLLSDKTHILYLEDVTTNLKQKEIKEGNLIHKAWVRQTTSFLCAVYLVCWSYTLIVSQRSGGGLMQPEPHREPPSPPETISALPPLELKGERGLIFNVAFHTTTESWANAEGVLVCLHTFSVADLKHVFSLINLIWINCVFSILAEHRVMFQNSGDIQI